MDYRVFYEGVQSEMEEALNALLKKRGCEYKVRFVCFPMETYEEDVAEYLENNSADIFTAICAS